MSIYDVIEEIAATPSKKDKEGLLKKYDSPLLRYILLATYNPRIRYYMDKSVDSIFEEELPLRVVGGLDQSVLSEVLFAVSTRKVTGQQAYNLVKKYIEQLTPKSAEVVRRIIKKDLRCGISDSTINKVFKDLIPSYPYQRCALFSKVDTSKWPWEEGVYAQEKIDSMYCNLNIDAEGGVQILSRQGSSFPVDKFPWIVHDTQCYDDNTQLHGEMVVCFRPDGAILSRKIGNGILNSVLKGGDFPEDCNPVLIVWDKIPLSESVPKGSYKVPYKERLTDLEDLTLGWASNIRVAPYKVVYSKEEALEYYSELLAEGKEGIVLKHPQAFWRDGTSKEQLKLKLEVDVDLVIKDFTEGKGKNASTFGAVICESFDGKLSVGVSGFTDDERVALSNNREEMIGQIMCVRSNMLMNPSKNNALYSLFLPRFVEVRQDKRQADSLQEIIDQFDNALKGN